MPTFNSHAIETSLHHVPDLAEHFLYFNDDFFIYDTLAPADFINENGTLNANLEQRPMVNSAVDPAAPDYLNAARNSANLLFGRYGYYPTQLHKHAPYSLNRLLLVELEAEFETALNRTREAGFRARTDINVASFLSHHYGFVKRAVVYAPYRTEHIQSNDPLSLVKLRELASPEDPPKAICINESGVPQASTRWRSQVAGFLAAQFPTAPPWERAL